MYGRKGVGKTMNLEEHHKKSHTKEFATEKRRNKAKGLTINSITCKFVKRTSTLSPVKSLR